ncbi:MAG TPA: AMP-binding protein [Pricia sp.]|nr:AMP-binding protein [Pricia sp.]
MEQHFWNIHTAFKLNGIAYSREDLREVAYNLIKEGEPFERTIGDFLLDWTDEGPTLQVRTSGSTGAPKMITLQKYRMVNSALATGAFLGLEPGTSTLLCVSAEYIAGKMMLVRAMVLGLELDCIAPSPNPLGDAFKTADLSKNTETPKPYDFCAMVPLQLQNSLDALGQIKILIVGGAPVSKKIRVQIPTQDHGFPTAVFETYGMTETITHIALKKLNAGTEEDRQHFKTLPNIRVSSDNRGCLVIHAQKIAEAPVVTNDVVHLVSETEFKWLGRYDNAINSGGVKLFPEQIEAKLVSIITSRFFVAGLPDERLGQKMVLVIEGETDREKLFQIIKSQKNLEKFEIPREIHQIPEFSMTDTGKIQRKQTLTMIGG